MYCCVTQHSHYFTPEVISLWSFILIILFLALLSLICVYSLSLYCIRGINLCIFAVRTCWLIQVFKICLSAMDLHRRPQQARSSDDSRKKKNESGKRSRRNWRSRRERKTSDEHPRYGRLAGNRTSVPRLGGWILGLRNYMKNLKKYEHSSWWRVMVVHHSQLQQESKVIYYTSSLYVAEFKSFLKITFQTDCLCWLWV